MMPLITLLFLISPQQDSREFQKRFERVLKNALGKDQTEQSNVPSKSEDVCFPLRRSYFNALWNLSSAPSLERIPDLRQRLLDLSIAIAEVPPVPDQTIRDQSIRFHYWSGYPKNEFPTFPSIIVQWSRETFGFEPLGWPTNQESPPPPSQPPPLPPQDTVSVKAVTPITPPIPTPPPVASGPGGIICDPGGRHPHLCEDPK